MLPMADLRSFIAETLDEEVVAMVPLGGGDVADSYRVVLADGSTVFAKTKVDAVPGFFVTEAAGLTWLRQAGEVAIPEVIAVSDEPAFLVQEWIEPGYPTPQTEIDLGRALARLHLSGAPSFGRDDRRSTGSRGLPNEPCQTWAEFYASQRLLPLAKLAKDGHALPDRAISDIEAVAMRIDDLVGPVEPPARLHGDLWAGNRLVGAGGVSWLIDPAAHGGHREFDLAMMRLFGGYGDDCFGAYAEIAPLADGWAERIALNQLAPLIVHSIKFGGPYVPATQQALTAVL
jgi:fructosamine-3-kinase